MVKTRKLDDFQLSQKLREAIRKGNEASVKRWIKKGAKPGFSALSSAVRNGVYCVGKKG